MTITAVHGRITTDPPAATPKPVSDRDEKCHYSPPIRPVVTPATTKSQEHPTGGADGARDGAHPSALPPNRERPTDFQAPRDQHKDDVTGTASSARRYHPEQAVAAVTPAAPSGVEVQQRGDVRVVTVNTHQGVPGRRELGDEHESRAALEDVSSYVRSINADVVVVQEIDDDDDANDHPGVNDQARLLADLMGATDSAFTPAVRHSVDAGTYGTGIYTRNGYTLAQAHNIDLPNEDVEEDRSAGLAEVVAPDGQSFSVLYSHLTVGGEGENKAARQEQIEYLSTIAKDVGRTGSVTYTDALTGAELTATGLPTDKIVLAGDMNAQHEDLDEVFAGADLTSVRRSPYVRELITQAFKDPFNSPEREQLDEIFRGTTIHGDSQIDHVYTRGMEVHNNFVGDIPEDKLDEVATDHRPVVTDLDLGAAPASGGGGGGSRRMV